MTTYIIRRLLQTLVVLLLVTMIIFLALRTLPGNPVLMLVTSNELQEFTDEQIEALKKEFGLDKSITVQYANWLVGLLTRGDLGNSIVHRSPVTGFILERLPVTFHLGILALITSIIIGVPAGIICAVRRGKWADSLVTLLANLGITAPGFWVGILLIYVFGLYFKILPVFGYTSPFTDFSMSTRQVIMPVFCLAVFPIASITRQTRSSMLEVMRQDYIRTAWSKGLQERVIIARHAVKNGLIPVVTLLGMNVGIIIGGSVLIETVFNIPGMGRLAVDAIINQDYPMVQGVTLLVASAVAITNLAVDLSYGWLDPRIRYG
jgi:peptide/nickel transport system permease protein